MHGGYAFGFDGSILSCIDLADGARKWKGGRYGEGQLVLLPEQNLLLVLSEDGELALVSATPDKFTEIERVPAIEGKTWNHPVLVGDRLGEQPGEPVRLASTVRDVLGPGPGQSGVAGMSLGGRQEARLADARLPDHHDDPPASGPGAYVDDARHGAKLARAADELVNTELGFTIVAGETAVTTENYLLWSAGNDLKFGTTSATPTASDVSQDAGAYERTV